MTKELLFLSRHDLGDATALIPLEYSAVDSKLYTWTPSDKIITISTSLQEERCTLPVGDFNQDMPSDQEQKFMLNKFGINTPKTYFPKSKSSLSRLLAEYGREMCIKANHQNRGIGKAFIDSEKLMTILHDNNLDSEKFAKYLGIKHYGEIRVATEQNTLYNQFHSDHYHVEEFINIDREFRLIYVAHASESDYVVYERTNYGINKPISKFKETPVKTSIVNKKLRRLIKKLGDASNALFMSFDVYQDKDGEWGVIEYNTNFALECYSPAEIKKLGKQTKNALDTKYTEKNDG